MNGQGKCTHGIFHIIPPKFYNSCSRHYFIKLHTMIRTMIRIKTIIQSHKMKCKNYSFCLPFALWDSFFLSFLVFLFFSFFFTLFAILVINDLMSRLVGQLFWQGASAHFKHLGKKVNELERLTAQNAANNIWYFLYLTEANQSGN